MSDGELDEGSTWESLLIASHHNLHNLLVLVDRNGLQSLEGTEETLALEPLKEKFEAFGWETKIVDGHNHDELSMGMAVNNESVKPIAIIGKTTNGKGVSFMENAVRWHYRPPNDEELAAALREVGDYEK
jgi:transketolase